MQKAKVKKSQQRFDAKNIRASRDIRHNQDEGTVEISLEDYRRLIQGTAVLTVAAPRPAALYTAETEFLSAQRKATTGKSILKRDGIFIGKIDAAHAKEIVAALNGPAHTLTAKLREVMLRARTDGGGEPKNAERALWGELAITSFASETGQSDDVKDDPETVIGDLLADVMHFCDAHEVDFDAALERGRNHHDEEVKEEATAEPLDEGDVPLSETAVQEVVARERIRRGRK